MSVKIEGMRELLANLSQKEDDIIKAARAGNLAGAKVVMDELRSNVPQGRTGKLGQAVTMSGNRTDNQTYENYVAVGFNKSANWRSHLPEFGSISQAPQGYMTKTEQSTEKEVYAEMEKAIRGALS